MWHPDMYEALARERQHQLHNVAARSHPIKSRPTELRTRAALALVRLALKIAPHAGSAMRPLLGAGVTQPESPAPQPALR